MLVGTPGPSSPVAGDSTELAVVPAEVCTSLAHPVPDMPVIDCSRIREQLAALANTDGLTMVLQQNQFFGCKQADTQP